MTTNPDPDLVTALSRHLAGTDLVRLDLRGPDGELRLVRTAEGFAIDQGPPNAQERIVVRAAGFGSFLSHHPLRSNPCASIGAAVQTDDILGFLSIGPMLMPVTAPVAGIVAGVFLHDGDIAGFGTPLFQLEPQEGGS